MFQDSTDSKLGDAKTICFGMLETRALRIRHFVCMRENGGWKASWGREQVGDESVDARSGVKRV